MPASGAASRSHALPLATAAASHTEHPYDTAQRSYAPPGPGVRVSESVERFRRCCAVCEREKLPKRYPTNRSAAQKRWRHRAGVQAGRVTVGPIRSTDWTLYWGVRWGVGLSASRSNDSRSPSRNRISHIHSCSIFSHVGRLRAKTRQGVQGVGPPPDPTTLRSTLHASHQNQKLTLKLRSRDSTRCHQRGGT